MHNLMATRWTISTQTIVNSRYVDNIIDCDGTGGRTGINTTLNGESTTKDRMVNLADDGNGIGNSNNNWLCDMVYGVRQGVGTGLRTRRDG
jgi:hypothetical protein